MTRRMHLGYNTNGLAHHDPLQALELLAESGYRSVALTLDHGWANPYSDSFPQQLNNLATALERLGLRSVVETGARFLLDPRSKHEPTLVSPLGEQRARRIDFLRQAIDVAQRLGSDCVSLWSGIVRDEVPDSVAMKRLVEALRPVLDYAATRNVLLGFEPEPGMLIDTMVRYDELADQLAAPHFRLTLDVGHLHCQGETPLAQYIARYAPQLVNVHIEDMRAGVHEHLMFGEGEIDFDPVLVAFARAGYPGGLHVELSRHSHDAPRAVRSAMEFLGPRLARAAAAARPPDPEAR